jgi:selenocysteine-specific elongation factor
VTESIRELLGSTALADIEIVPVSSTTRSGLSELQLALDRALARVERASVEQPARLPIDRVFSIAGFGTIVTGTLTGATLRAGDRVEISPGGRLARIRGLQTFGAQAELAEPGSRVAVNLSGLEPAELDRGDVLSVPGALEPAVRLDARVRMLASSERALAHNDEVIVFAGSSETSARAAILDGEALAPGHDGWVQLRFARPIVVLAGDRFILRRPSPPETIGGGTVIELDPPRHKRNQPDVVARLIELAAGDPAERLLAWFGSHFKNDRQLASAPIGANGSQALVEGLLADGRLRRVGPSLAATAQIDAVQAELNEWVGAFHRANPLESGMPRELLRETAKLDRPVFDALLSESDSLEVDRHVVRRVGFRIELDAERQRSADAYLALLRVPGFQPPTTEEAGIEPELVRAMARIGWIVEIGDGIAFTPERLTEAQSALIGALAETTSIALAEYRDHLGTTRRYAQALLEYFDRQGVTRRVGDRRVAARPSQHQEGPTPR